jgi:hypothetical protein
MGRRLGLLVTATLALTARSALADCGGIAFSPGAAIFEPNQRAVIGFNGREEILVLSTDLRASEPTKVLQVLPLPGEPKVAKGDFSLFVKATDLINLKLARPPRGSGGGMGGMGDGGAAARSAPAGEVTFHDKIGSHDISVTHVLHRRGFVDWVENYLRKAGVDNPTIPEPMKAVVDEYLRDRFQWFVFDVVELGKEVKTKEAIQYHFPTRSLYYPLRITRTEEGDTMIRLLVLSPNLVRLPNTGSVRVRVAHDPIRITSKELQSLGNDEMTAFLESRSCMLRIWEVTGPLSGFKRDIVTSMLP